MGFSTTLLGELFRHMEWGDAEVWRAAALLDGPTDTWLRDRLHHLHVVQRAFLSVWTGQPMPGLSPDGFASLTDVRVWARPYYAEAQRFVDACSAEALATPLVMPWVAPYERQLGRTFQVPTLGETMFQVTNHSTYHRGQVNAKLRELGIEPPNVDFIVWIWLGRPSPRWA